MKKLLGVLVVFAMLVGSYLPASAEKFTFKSGGADRTVYLRVYDSSSSTGARLATLAFNTGSLDCDYTRAGAAATGITLATQTAAGAHSDGGFVHIGKGLYRLDLPDAATAAGVNSVHIDCDGAASMVPAGVDIELVAYDPQDTVRLGLTALPNAAADAAGGLPISDAGGLDLDSKLANTNEVTAARMGALTDWINGGRLDLIIDAVLADTNELQTDWTNGGRLDLIIDSILVDTAEIGTAGAGLTNVPWNASWDAEVESEVNDGLVALHLDHLLATTYDPASKPGAADALLNELVENDGGVARYTANALETAPTGSGDTAAVIADAVWDELRSGHTSAGSFGEGVLIADGGITPTSFATAGTISVESGTTLSLSAGVAANDQFNFQAKIVVYAASGGAIEASSCIIDTVNGAPDQVITAEDITAFIATSDPFDIVPDAGCAALRPTTLGRTADLTTTGEIGVDLSNVNGTLDASEIGTDAITAAKIAADAIGASEVAAGAITSSEAPNLDAAISTRASQTSVTTIDDFLDTEVAAILADTNELQTDWVNGGRLDLILDARAAEATLNTLIPTALTFSGGNVKSYFVEQNYNVVDLTNESGDQDPTTTAFDTDLTQAVNISSTSPSPILYFPTVTQEPTQSASCNLQGARARISAYNTTTKVLTVTTLPAAPDYRCVFRIY